VLALTDGALTGSFTQPGRGGGDPTVVQLTEASYKDGVVAFSVVTEGRGGTTTTKYQGKVEGNTITGTREAPGRGGGDPTTTEWVATRGE